MTRKRGLE